MKRACFSIFVLMAMTFNTRAALFFSETFSYPNGPLQAVLPVGTWNSFGGTANQLDVAAGRAHLTQAESQDVGRGIVGGVGIGATVFFGFDLNVTTAPAIGTAGNFFAHLGQSTGSVQLAKVFILPGTIAGRYRVGVANGNNTASVVFPAELLLGVDYRVVVRYVSPATGGPPQTTLWIDPCSVQSTSVTATDAFNPGSLNAFVLRQDSNIGVLDVDNLRVATLFPEVGGDTTPPVITCPADITTPATSAAGAVVAFIVSATDNADPTPSITCTPLPSGSTFPIGTTQVTCRALDDCGNGASCTFLVTVVQQPPLQIACPRDLTVAAITATGAPVNYPSPSVTGGCPPYAVSCNPPSGSVFPVGSSVVNCIVSDSCNHSTECQFKVTVVRRFVEVDKMPYGTAQLSLLMPNGGTEVVTLAGPTTVNVFFDGENEGDATDDDGDGRDEVDTEMVDMDLRGNSSMGPVQVVLQPTQASVGQIEETDNRQPGRLDIAPFGPAGSTGDSFFDVFVEIRVAGRVFRPAKPLHMAGIIRHKPPAPGDTYINPFTDPIELLDENGRPTGIFVVREVHTPNPEKEIDVMTYGTAQLSLTLPGGQTEVVTLAGPTTVEVDIAPNGAAADTDGDGLDQVPSTMTAMHLAGNSSMGPVVVMLDPARPTLGEIEETANTMPGRLDVPPFAPNGTANSFFDVFAVVQVGGQTFRTAGPLHMSTVIRHKPPAPGDTYVNPFLQPVPLLDANGRDTGIRVVREVHTPNPEKEIDVMTYGTAQLSLKLPNGQTEVVTLAGPTTVEVAIAPNGAAADTDGDGRDQVPTQMTAMDLRGNSSQGPVRVTLDPARPTLGEIEETVNNTPGRLDVPPFAPVGTADSFFDVFAIVEVSGQTFRTAGPLHMSSVIRHKPPAPGDTYVNPFLEPVQLLSANGLPTGIFVVREVHTPNPEKEIDRFPATLADVTIQLANGGSETVRLVGPTTVEVCIPPDGTAADTDGDGRDQVPTHMTELSLDGVSSIGPVRIRLAEGSPTLGEIEEQANNTPGKLDLPPFTPAGTADSFFDVFVEIEIAGVPLHNKEPLRMTSVIRHKPPAPGDEYVNPFLQPVELLDANGNPTGIRIVREVHTPNPNCVVNITCPPDMKVLATGAAGAVVNYPPPVATGSCPPITVVCNPPPGSVFPLGTTTVTCTATDSQNNRASCSFRVTVTRRFVEVDKMPYGTAQLSLLMPNGGTEVVTLAGPTTVNVMFDGENEGDATDDDGDGRDEVDTEMVDMDLRGNSSMGVVQVVLQPDQRSMGMIEETSNTQPGRLDVPPFAAAGTADSFFDIFPEIRVAGRVFRPASALRMAGIIRHKPPGPGDTYINPFTQPVDLLDENGNPTGIKVVREVHTPNPEKEIDQMQYGTAQLSLTLPNGQTEVVTLAGPTTVAVDIAPNGAAADTDGDGLEQVPTEMLFMHLTGNSSMGPVVVTLDPARPTLGEIEETANNTPGLLDVPPFAAAGTANSTFNVFAIVQVGAQTFHTDGPLRMQSIIRHKPPAPGDTYVNPFLQPVELLDANGRPTGIKIVREVHTPNPEKEIDVLTYGTAQISVTLPNGGTETVALAGPTTVVVCIPPDGTAADTDGDGRDQVPTEMTAMDLRGTSSVGPVRVTLDPTRRTLGEIEETANTLPGRLDVPPFAPNGTADSFFDVYAVMTVGNLVLHPAQALHMQSIIRHKPPAPGDTYVNPFLQPVDLLDANGNPTGIRIVREVHTPNPEKERDFFSYTQGKINLRLPNGQIERVIVAGPTEVLVNIPPGGTAADTDGDGLDQVPMEMVNLNLVGNSSLGPVMVMLDSDRCRTLGEIEEKVNNTPGVLDIPPFTPTGGANSRFELCIKIVVNGRVFRPCDNVLVHIESMISHKPPGPGEAYMNLINQEVPLCDENGSPTGIILTGEMHTPNPPKEIDFFPNTLAQLTVRLPNGAEETVNLAGPTRVVVCIDDIAGSPGYGLAADTDGDGRDQVPTEMTLLQLAGVSSIGPVQVSLRADRPSLGEIEETVNLMPGVLDVPPFGAAGTTADSFFDIWPLISVGGQTFTTASPLHMAARIRHKPPAPGDEYVNPFTEPVELLDAAGNRTGIFVVREVHTPNPDCRVAINCPTNITVWTCSPNGQVVSYPAPTATSTCNLPLAIACVPPSGSNFPPGNNPVTCTARDSLGNTASCTFLVRVIQDTLPPQIVCPADIRVETCFEREQVFYAVTATDDCDTNVTIVCTPPSGSAFPAGTTPVVCKAVDDCGHTSECRFLVTVTRLPAAPLTITRTSDGRLIICWSSPCDDYVLQCTRSLNTPILWETIPGPYPGTAAQHCITNSPNSPYQFYRLIKRKPAEVFEPTGTLPPQGAYMSPADELTVVLATPTAGAAPHRVLARWFVHPIPVPPIVVPRPPPCLTCPPETYEFQTPISFQLSMDEGKTWADVSAIADVAVLVGFDPQPEPPGVRSINAELLRLDAKSPGPPELRLRESPTRQSLGKTQLRMLEDGTFRVSSFFDVFVEFSMDDGQTWIPALTPIHMELSPRAPAVPERTDALPPAGAFDSPSGHTTRYANGLLIRGIIHPIPQDAPPPVPPRPNPPCLTCPPATFRFRSQISFEASMDGGQTWMTVNAMSDVGLRSRQSRSVGGLQTYDTEMLLMDVHGDGGIGLPVMVMLRESPTRPSLGLTRIRESPSLSMPFVVDSFFDIFTEVSLDGGQTWSQSLEATHVELNPQPFPPAQ